MTASETVLSGFGMPEDFVSPCKWFLDRMRLQVVQDSVQVQFTHRFSSTRSGCLASRGDLAVGAGLGLVDSSTSSTPVFAALQIGLDSTHVYLDITQWRSRLKIINAEIAETQQDSYNDIASGIKLQDGCWLVED